MKCKYCGHEIVEDNFFGRYVHERTTSTGKCGYLALWQDSFGWKSTPCWCDNPEPESKESNPHPTKKLRIITDVSELEEWMKESE